ncbi:hypothetical protein D3C85_786870 [compost metagenome]
MRIGGCANDAPRYDQAEAACIRPRDCAIDQVKGAEARYGGTGDGATEVTVCGGHHRTLGRVGLPVDQQCDAISGHRRLIDAPPATVDGDSVATGIAVDGAAVDIERRATLNLDALRRGTVHIEDTVITHQIVDRYRRACRIDIQRAAVIDDDRCKSG